MLVINYSRMPGFNVTYTTDSPAIPHRDGAGVLWRNWRFLENRMLFDVSTDPHQDRDIASQHPEVVSKMRDHLQSWWDGVKAGVMKPQRVIIGSDAENPMMLTACEWLDVFVDQQLQVRRGVQKNGTWHLEVARPGKYRFELRRWPRESGFKLTASVPETPVTDGTFVAGKSLPIAMAQLKLGNQTLDLKPEADERSFVTNVDLKEGDLQLTATMMDSQGQELCGAYYVYVHRTTND